MTAPRAPAPTRPVHHPELDGLRGLAVAGVLAFHAGLPAAAGGFLGVSAFFTLSGFLVTTLLLAEHARHGRLDLARFWSRRVRRLAPAALVTLGAVAALAATGAGAAFRSPSLRGDVLAALGQVSNWRAVLAGRSYGDLFAVPSPVDHFWSLAVEAQVYVVLPLGLLALLRLGGRRRRVLVHGLVAALAASVATGWWMAGTGRAGAAYYATPVRAGEVLVGCLLAVVLAGRATAGDGRPRRALAVAGLPAAAVLLWSWTWVPDGAAWLFRGGLLAHGLATALVVAAALEPGPLGRLLRARPLAGLGRVSYAVYLVHWPLFLLLTPEVVGLDGVALLALRLAATLVLAVGSTRLLEQPVRQGRGVPAGRGWVVGLPATAAVVAVALAVPVVPDVGAFTPPPLIAAPSPREGAGRAPAAAPARVAVVGDSTALRTALGLDRWGDRTGRLRLVGAEVPLGCTVGEGGRLRYHGTERGGNEECAQRDERWSALVATTRPDVVVVQAGPFDVADRQLPGSTRWAHVGQPEVDAWLLDEMTEAVDALATAAPQGVRVVWLTAPLVEVGRGDQPPRADPASEPARMRRFNELVRAVARRRPDVAVVDLAGWMAAGPGGELDPRLRPDGVHFTEETAAEVAEWLGPAVLGVVDGEGAGGGTVAAGSQAPVGPPPAPAGARGSRPWTT